MRPISPSASGSIQLGFILVLLLLIAFFCYSFYQSQRLRQQLTARAPAITVGMHYRAVKASLGFCDARISPSEFSRRGNSLRPLAERGVPGRSENYKYWISSHHDYALFVGFDSEDRVAHVLQAAITGSRD